MGMKQYDQTYFDRWYRRSRVGVGRTDFVDRKVKLAVAAAEYLMGRRVESVLDVGCGEAPWRAILKRMRPKLQYTGVDSSEYVVERFGKKRNIHLGELADLPFMGLGGPFDLVVCSDVLHYVRTPDVRAGLHALAKLASGVAFIEAFTSSDDIEGDRDNFQNRTTAVYEKLFAEAGFQRLAMHLYVVPEMAKTLVALEKGGA